jgi:hypothetical protein
MANSLQAPSSTSRVCEDISQAKVWLIELMAFSPLIWESCLSADGISCACAYGFLRLTSWIFHGTWNKQARKQVEENLLLSMLTFDFFSKCSLAFQDQSNIGWQKLWTENQRTELLICPCHKLTKWLWTVSFLLYQRRGVEKRQLILLICAFQI